MIKINSTAHYDKENFWKYGIISLWMALSAHIVFIYFFYINNVPEMDIFNDLSILIFIFCIYLVKRKYYKLATIIVYIEVILHAILSTYYVGIESGFYYYIFVLVIVSLLVKQESTKAHIIKSILFMAAFFFMEIAFSNIDPIYVIDVDTLLITRVLNIFGLLMFSIPFMYYYISKDIETSKQMYSFATIDQLTNLYNRRYMDSIVEYEFSKRDFTPLVLVLADIDFFKKINDTYGHHCGDEVLVEISKTLQNTIRHEDTISRWGGEEFLFFMPEASIENAKTLIARVQKNVADLSFTCDGVEDIKVTLTFVIAKREKGEEFDSALARADIALYDGKLAGRDCVVISGDNENV